MGGPTIDCANACEENGIRLIDVRMEQAAAMMANAYARMTRRPGVCMAASGPGTVNLLSGVAHSFVDGAPIVAIGGSSPVNQYGLGAFQEMDQVGLARPITVWAERCYEAHRIPELVATAFHHATFGRPGPVYLDLPGDVLYHDVPLEDVRWIDSPTKNDGPAGATEDIERAFDLLATARQPIAVSGSGVIWSGATTQLLDVIERIGLPFYTTPQGRGVVPEDHSLHFPAARSSAFREADCILLVGTRLNYVIGHLKSPRFREDAKFIQVDVDPKEIGITRRPDVAVLGDAKKVLQQFAEVARSLGRPERYRAWTEHLTAINRKRSTEAEIQRKTAQRPIHPLRLCKEIRDFMDRDAVLCVDGQEILNFARQSIPIYEPAHAMSSGCFGTMGVGLPCGIGAKIAKPNTQVIVLHGDGSFGINGFEMDTAVRHNLPIIVVISNNGGWTGRDRPKAGRELGFSRYDEAFEALGCHGEFVEKPEYIRPALRRAAAAGKPAVINVMVDPDARATTAKFTAYST